MKVCFVVVLLGISGCLSDETKVAALGLSDEKGASTAIGKASTSWWWVHEYHKL